MRIVGRSESPSFPPLETLLPMEKSWALEVEREEQTSCLQYQNERLDRGTESFKQIEGNWVSCKRLNIGSKEASHRNRERENELYSKRASRSFDSKPYRDDWHNDFSRHAEETKRAWQFASSSRCYPPSVHIRSSESSVSTEARLQTQSGLHAARKFVKPNRTNNSFACRQHLTRSENGFSRESQGVKPLSTLESRQDHFACPKHRAEMLSVYKASKKHREHVDDLSHIQDHQELGDCKHEFQPSFDEHSQYRHDKYSVKSGFLEHRHRHRYVKSMEHQGPCHGVTDWKNAKKCGRSIVSEMRQHNEAVLTVQSCEEKSEITNAAAEAVTTMEDALPKGIGMLESSCTEESEVKKDDSMLSKKQYEMLASLLFDDLQDIDEDNDVTLVGEGLDSEYTGSSFDDLEASMDIDDDTEDKEEMSAKVAAVGITKHPDCISGKASAVESSASQHAKKLHNAYTSSRLKQSPSVLVDVTNKFEICTSPGVKGEEQEGDAHRLSQRQRQIEFGKNTLGYEHYSELIPRIKRKAKDPQTPNPKQVCSKRSWDGQIRKWRRLLHVYDPPSEDGEEIADDFSILKLHRSNLEEKGPAAKEDTSLALRFSESDESKGCIAVVDRENVGDANLTIYDDWMEP